MLLDLGFHKLDDAWCLMGCPEPVSVYCAMHCAFADLGDKQALSLPYAAADVAMGMVQFANGASLSMAATFALNTSGHPLRVFDPERGSTAMLPDHGDAVSFRNIWVREL